MTKAFLKGKVLKYLLFWLFLTTMSEAHDQNALKAVASSSHSFATKLYKFLREDPGNVFFSPTSLEVVMALTQTGARGKTAEEIIAALQLPNDQETVKNGYNAVMSSLKSTDDMVLEIANKIYSDQTFALEQEFQLVAEKTFFASAENVDFVKNPEPCRLAMNDWVVQQTRGKISDLFGEGDITPDTRMVLINAVYFKGKWKHPFDVDVTNKKPFYITPSETKEVDMMHIKKNFGYAELNDLKAKMLVMPYVGDKMFMVILLPNEIDGLAEMEQKLHTVNVANLMKKTNHLEVEVSLPRFKIETTMDLKNHLIKLGAKSMFNPQSADFSGISKEKGLYVSKVVQKAFIEVNEEGSEAAAATALRVRCKRAANWPEEFTADHPFIIHLCGSNGVVLFSGRVSQIGSVNGHDSKTSEPPDLPHVEL